MASSKAEFVAAGDVPATTLLSPSTPVSSSSAGARPDVQTRKSNRSRTSNFLSSTLLRPRGKSVSYTRANDWGRPVGGSEGLGCIYNPTMDTRERSQVLRSVTHLTKDRSDDVSGAAAEAFSGNATPSLAQRSRFFASFRSGSSTSVREADVPEAPPSYQQPDQRPELRRGSEGSVVSHISLPRPDGGLTHSSSRQSLSSSRPSYFSSGASSSASGSAISSGYTSVAASPGPGSSLGKQQQLQQQPQWQSSSSSSSSQRRSSSHLGAAARQAFRSSRSFLGLPNGDISEDAEAAQSRQLADTNGSPDNALDMDGTRRQAKQVANSDVGQLKEVQQSHRSQPGEVGTGSSEAMTGFTAANNDEPGGSRPEALVAELQSHSRAAAVSLASNLDSAAAAGQASASLGPIGRAHPTNAAAAGSSGRREVSTTAGVSVVGSEARAESPAISKFLNFSNFAQNASHSDPPSQLLPNVSAESPASAAPASAASASASTVSQAPAPQRSPASASAGAGAAGAAAASSQDDDALSPLRPTAAAASPLQPVSASLTLPQSQCHSQSQPEQAPAECRPLRPVSLSSSQQKPSIHSPALETHVPAYSTASSTPLTSALPSVIANDASCSSSPSSPSSHLNPSSSLLTSPSSSRTPSRPDIGVAAPSSSFTTTFTTTTTSSATDTAASTATTDPLQSTSKLAPVLRSGSSSLPSTQRNGSSPAPASATASASVTTPSQHVSSLSTVPLDIHLPAAKQSEPATSSRSAELSSPSSASASASSPHHESGALPLTPPSSSGPCLSPRSSVSGASDPRVAVPVTTQSTHDLPSPPASTAHGSVSNPASRRGSSNDPLASSVSVRSPRSSFASPRPSSQALEPTPSSSGTGRVSFDLRRISLFGGASSASKMSSSGPRASFAGVGNGQPPQATDANGVRHASSPSSGSTSKFFSRISLPGGNRRGSGNNDSPLSSPESKSRSRFASFGRLSRGNDAQTSPNGTRGLRNSMQPWASASTDVLAAEGRNSLALAREEATRPRKSLHLPRSNLIDLDAEDTSDTTASTSTATHGFDSRALPPIATASIKPEKPASPSLNSARRPSFNFLRRPSAASTNSNAENANGERRGSFARTFMNRTLSRNSKTENQQEAARSIQTPHGEVESPAFRNGIFDTQSPVSASSVVYPGMSSTVNWNAPTAAQSKEHADIGPGEVDPSVVIPAYPGTSAAISGASAQPKNVVDLTSGVLAERRPSQGIDQEQDAAEAGDTVSNTLASSRPSSVTAPVAQSTDSTATRQRPTRTSHALSHLPRLDSMRAIGGASGSSNGAANGARTARSGSESTTDTTAGETSEEEQEPSEDEDETDVTGQTSDYHDLDTETEDETDDDTSPTASRHMAAAPMAATGSSGGLNRNRPTESLILPPAPSFIPNPTSSFAAAGADGSASSANGAGANSGAFNQTVGRESWTSFNPSGFTPFETPTPSFGGGSFNSAFAGPTPRARQELSESSYFAARPGTSNSGRATTAGTMSGDAPPPSPSIISRSRAPSSASMRTLRTPGAGAMSSGPVPNRSMPAPVGALPPLALHRQISAASGSTARGGADRSKSPALASASSRPGTSGTLTPHQAPAGERISSREPSIDRPASERPASRQEDGKAATPKTTTTRQIVGLDGMPVSNARPNFYQQKSRSLVDLLGPASRRLEIDTVTPPRPVINEPSAIDALRTPTTPRPTSEVPAYSKKDGLAPINTGLTAPASIASPGGMSLSRRRSMFEMRAEPPPYSIIHNRPEGPQIILPREEEGREKLPTYCCGVHIEGYLPRKMEFSAPGVQAKDRSWRRQYFVLHGTSLRVYKNDLSVDRHAANGSWGEMKGVHVHLEPMNEDGSNGSGSGIGLGAAAREAISHTPLGHHRHDASKNKEAGTEFDSKNGLIRNYTLQGAESGLAADYLKRRHVVRVRAEGEQFLLQTRSDRHVVDWIEALQAATNVSMDLEKRPMPKFITLPRRRRRRRRNPDGTTISPEEQEARDLAEAQRRSMADTGVRGAGSAAAGSGGAEATPRTSMAGRPSMSIENELNPSAAFERMLREDQEEGGRQTAAVM